MGRRATNTVEFNYQATDKVARTAKGKPRTEWRISGVDGLVLVTQPTGTATWYFFYRDRATGKTQKHRIGEYVPESEWRRHKEAVEKDPNAPPILTLAEARRVAEEQRHAVQDGTDPVALKRARANAMTFQQLAERFLEEAPHLATKTRRAYRYALEKDAYPAIGAIPANEVTSDHVLDICKAIEGREIVTLVNGKRLKRSPRIQSQRTKTTIGGVFRWAKENGHGNVKTNPARDVTPRAGVTRRKRTPTDNELKVLWLAAENEKSRLTQPMRLVVRLAVLTAQRRDEVAGARKSELRGLDGDSPLWVIPGDEVHRGLVIKGRTKNGREQHVPLSKQAAALFREAVELSKDKEFVFPADMKRVKVGRTPRTGHINGESVTMAMRRIRKDTGIADVTVHDLRRACSNWLKDQGVSREVRDLVLNHLDQSVTEQHYSAEARMEKQVRAAFQAWADHVSVVIGQPAQASNVIPIPARA